MVKTKLALAFALLCSVSAFAQTKQFEWSTPAMDGTRTGVTLPMADNVDKAIGIVEKKTYYAPNGKIFKKGSTPLVANLMIEAQAVMAPVKERIGYTSHYISNRDSEIANLIVDCLMSTAERKTGIHIDAGLTNYGGIRVDLAEGNILLDDIMSMLPFKNCIVVLEMSGKQIRDLLDNMAKTRFQVLGGVRVSVNNGEIVEAEIGGKPIDDDAVYHLATIDFLLNGGDNIFAAKYASDIIQTDVLIRDALLDYLYALREEGKPLEYDSEERVTYLNQSNKQ